MASGFDMQVDLSETYQRCIYFSGLYDPYLTRLFKQLLEPGDVMVDGGANIGYFSLFAARRVGKRGAVHAFEPVPATFEALSANIALNGCTTIRANRLALSRCAEELCFEIPTDTRSGAALGRLATIALRGCGPRVTVPACALDDYAASSDIAAIKLVKLDLEGSELAAIEGMQRLLAERRIAYLICELNTVLLDALGIPHSAIRQVLREYGYRCFYISHYIGFWRVEHVDLIDASHPGVSDRYGDYLFVAPGMPIPERI